MPWPDVPTAWERLKKREIPERREFSVISDDIWEFVKKCWSPRAPDVRPSALEVLSFILDNLKNVSTLLHGDSRSEQPIGRSQQINVRCY